MSDRARILIVEDNPDNMTLMSYLLTSRGYDPIQASDGRSGIEAARTHRPDLMLLDIQLPDIDGYQVASAVRADGRLQGVKLIAVTAFAMVGDREHIIASGFDGCLTKPINPETFVDELEGLAPGANRS